MFIYCGLSGSGRSTCWITMHKMPKRPNPHPQPRLLLPARSIPNQHPMWKMPIRHQLQLNHKNLHKNMRYKQHPLRIILHLLPRFLQHLRHLFHLPSRHSLQPLSQLLHNNLPTEPAVEKWSVHMHIGFLHDQQPMPANHSHLWNQYVSLQWHLQVPASFAAVSKCLLPVPCQFCCHC